MIYISIKNAFHNQKLGNIEIDIIKDGNDFQMFFRDDGIGMTNNTKKTLGLKLVELLASQLSGSINRIHINKGTKFQINFKGKLNKAF